MTQRDLASAPDSLDTAEVGKCGPVFESCAENIVEENGPGAGPWRRADGRDEVANVLLELLGFFDGTVRKRDRAERGVVDLVTEACVDFWTRNPVGPSADSHSG